jgi:hypothetical protein
MLPHGSFVVKTVTAILAAGTVSLLLWRDGDSIASHSNEPNPFSATSAPLIQETSFPRNRLPSPQGDAVGGDPTATEDRFTAAFAPSVQPRIETVTLRPPGADIRPPAASDELGGKSLRYLIGASSAGSGRDDVVTEVPYDGKPVKRGISIGYCNLFDETNSGAYGPYLHSSDTAAQYNEGQIDPLGSGWTKNLREQFERRRKQGFEYIELDNADAYATKDVIGAIELASSYGLKVIAKNPGLLADATSYVAHANVYGIIVERDAGRPDEMDALRRKAGKPDIPVWFVAFGRGRAWAHNTANVARNYQGMGVTYSSAGEYGNVIDILSPKVRPPDSDLSIRISSAQVEEVALTNDQDRDLSAHKGKHTYAPHATQTMKRALSATPKRRVHRLVKAAGTNSQN